MQYLDNYVPQGFPLERLSRSWCAAAMTVVEGESGGNTVLVLDWKDGAGRSAPILTSVARRGCRDPHEWCPAAKGQYLYDELDGWQVVSANSPWQKSRG
jgi:hypothetical protein